MSVLAMPTRAGGYKTTAGRSIPSVTQIINIGLGGYSKDALIAWAFKEGKEGRDYRKTRDAAASAGTLAHALIEGFLCDNPPCLDGHDEATVLSAQAAFDAFRTWHGQHDVRVIEQEVQLVDSLNGYGGCFDALIDLDGVRTLADWKSSKDIYGSMVAQVGAYYGLITVNRPHAEWPAQAVIVRAGKDGGLRVVTLGIKELLIGRKVFNHALHIYDYRAILDGMVARQPVTEPAIGTGNIVRLGTVKVPA
jgi:hypothetical protein